MIKNNTKQNLVNKFPILIIYLNLIDLNNFTRTYSRKIIGNPRDGNLFRMDETTQFSNVCNDYKIIALERCQLRHNENYKSCIH